MGGGCLSCYCLFPTTKDFRLLVYFRLCGGSCGCCLWLPHQSKGGSFVLPHDGVRSGVRRGSGVAMVLIWPRREIADGRARERGRPAAGARWEIADDGPAVN